MKYTIKTTGKTLKTIIKGIPEESLEKWKAYLKQKGYNNYSITIEKE